MRVLDRPAPSPSGPAFVAIGMFDGVHLGHQRLLQSVREDARAAAGQAVAVTFDRHPNTVVAPERVPPLIQSLSGRLETLRQLGMDAALVLRFSPALSQLTGEQFIRDLASGFGALGGVCVGEGFTFGSRRGGDLFLLRRLGREIGFRVHAVPPVLFEGAVVSSTRIRDLIQRGELNVAGALLGRPYAVRALVVPGDRRGRELGFPTANLAVEGLCLPPHGVYAARVTVEGTSHDAVVNLGLRPTLGEPEPQRHFEVHLLDFSGDLYSREVEVILGQQLRQEQRFASLDLLRDQIRSDVAAARRVLSGG